MASKRVECTSDGYRRIAYYRDDDNDSGYGEHAQEAFWYSQNTQDAGPDVDDAELVWHDITIDNSPDQFDLACERRHD
jgi:hypothetical protein